MGAQKKKKGRQKTRRRWLSWAVLMFVAGALMYWMAVPDGLAEPHPVTGGETRPILDSRHFPGHATAGYLAAALYPEAMDQVYCYCRCDRAPVLHKSLRSCFATSHGAG